MKDPKQKRFVDVGLPYGSRPRLILAHLNREALIYGSPRIEVEASLTAFIKRVTPNHSPNSRNILRFKDQLRVSPHQLSEWRLICRMTKRIRSKPTS